jgi:virulence-associated protein VapD
MKTTITRKVKLFSLGVLLAAAATLFVSCGKLSVNPATISAEWVGGNHSIAVTSNAKWTASTDAEWLALDLASGKGDGIITVNAAKNAALKSRTAIISVATGSGVPAGTVVDTITVTQAAVPGLQFTFTDKNVAFLAAAANMVVDWGDGTTEKYADLNRAMVSHAYTDNTAHTVYIQADTLFAFYCSRNLTALDVSNCATLDCSVNQLRALDVSNNTALTKLICNNNQLSALDLSKNTALTELNCNDNQLNALDVSNNRALITLRCWSNLLSALDASNNTALTALYCNNNQLSALDVSNNRELIHLICMNNQLSTLDVSNNTALTELICNNNQLSALNVSKNTALIGLYCTDNRLNALDVSNNTALTELYCTDNQISELDVSNNRELIHLNCMNNQLSTLDVSNNTALTELYCRGNQLSDTALNDLLKSLPDRSGMEAGRIYIGNNPGSLICDLGIARAKNWNVDY